MLVFGLRLSIAVKDDMAVRAAARLNLHLLTGGHAQGCRSARFGTDALLRVGLRGA